MINYSTTLRPCPSDTRKPIKAYANAQVSEVVTLEEFAKHITNHNSKYSRGDMLAVLVLISDCLKELLLNGKKVELGDLGSFWLTLRSDGAAFAEEFRVNNIRSVTPKWERGPAFRDLRAEAEFQAVATRAVQLAAVRAEKGGEASFELPMSATATVSVKADPADGCQKMGTIKGRGIYHKGVSVTLEAVPNPGFKFQKWNDGQTAPSRTLVAAADTALTATFAPDGAVTPDSGSDNDQHTTTPPSGNGSTGSGSTGTGGGLGD